MRGKIIPAKVSSQKYHRVSLVAAQIEQYLLPALPHKAVIILDNARFHRMKVLQPLVQKFGHKVLPLAPYSPELNPIEHTWANLKKHIRKCYLIIVIAIYLGMNVCCALFSVPYDAANEIGDAWICQNILRLLQKSGYLVPSFPIPYGENLVNIANSTIFVIRRIFHNPKSSFCRAKNLHIKRNRAGYISCFLSSLKLTTKLCYKVVRKLDYQNQKYNT